MEKRYELRIVCLDDDSVVGVTGPLNSEQREEAWIVCQTFAEGDILHLR